MFAKASYWFHLITFLLLLFPLRKHLGGQVFLAPRCAGGALVCANKMSLSKGMGPSGKCLPMLCPCVCSWEGVWRPGKVEVKWSPLLSNTGSLYISKSNGGRAKRGKEWMGDSGKDTHLEIFHTCLHPRVPLYSMSSVTANTDCEKKQRGIGDLTESSS